MKKILLSAAIVIAVVGTSAFARAEEAKGGDVAAIKALEANFVAGVQAKSADRIMANYVRSPDLVVFDVIPPRQYTGWEAYKKDWQGVLDGCKDAPKMEMSDVSIDAGTRYGFGHNIQHFVCADTKGGKFDMTLRVTDGYRKIKGKWLIAHEHISVPVDLATGKADLSSKP